MTKLQDLKDIKKGLWHVLGGVCAVKNCGKKFGKGCTVHHVEYKDGEKIYSDFDDPLEYYKYLEPIVCNEPERFLPLCFKHHWAVELFKKYNIETLNSLVEIAIMS